MLKKFLIGVVLLAILGYGAYYYMSYHYGVKDYSTATADFSTKAPDLKSEFVADETKATQKYQDKAVAVSGIITTIAGDVVSFDGVDMKFSSPVSGLKVGDEVSVKGRFVGYDSLVESIQLDQCTVQK